eukprot:CAMPEP_0176313276 /NCGR_PEP_ID=MMETSP0121_2-20121125/67092_1 /TAXON_ID=160619 /ORGANISM="Kryptoperidinium foliaceum, Strain CCMP 1326" /LENGTH=65 /DNA_ID=CAMNT_0017655367 /DNA_START=376 /DNA_END=570 /DNA_ORIENTATION=+
MQTSKPLPQAHDRALAAGPAAMAAAGSAQRAVERRLHDGRREVLTHAMPAVAEAGEPSLRPVGLA